MQIAAKLTGKEYIPTKTEEKSLVKKFIKGLFGGKK
jgi:septum site-determining protein MinD